MPSLYPNQMNQTPQGGTQASVLFKAFQLIPTLWFVGSTVRQTLTDRRTESVELSFSFFYAGYSTRLLSFIKCPPSEVPCLSHCLS